MFPQTDFNVSAREMRLAESVSNQLQQSLTRRRIDPVFSDIYVTSFLGMTPLIAVLDTTRMGDHAPYINPHLLHQLSTDLGGLPVYLSNHSGIRYVVLLSRLPKLPRKVDLPLDAPAGKLAIGVRFTGQPVILEWEKFLHLAVLGATGSGKSVFLQSLVYQAMRDGMKVLLSDIDQTSFGRLAESASLAAPIAKSTAETMGLVEQALAECERRAELFNALPEHPQKLTEYNALAKQRGLEPLPRMLVVLDEASTVLTRMGGAKGAMGEALATLGWRGRKFGMHFVFAAQEFTKDLVGPVRSQVGLSLCFRVDASDKQMATRMGCTGAERIPENRQGLAVSNRYGPLQTYYFDPALFGTAGAPALPLALTPYDANIAHRALTETDGKISLEVLTKFGLSQGAARRLQENWKFRGWAENDLQRANGLYMTPNHPFLATNPQAPQTPTNRLQTLQTEPTNPQTGLQTLQTEPTYY